MEANRGHRPNRIFVGDELAGISLEDFNYVKEPFTYGLSSEWYPIGSKCGWTPDGDFCVWRIVESPIISYRFTWLDFSKASIFLNMRNGRSIGNEL